MPPKSAAPQPPVLVPLATKAVVPTSIRPCDVSRTSSPIVTCGATVASRYDPIRPPLTSRPRFARCVESEISSPACGRIVIPPGCTSGLVPLVMLTPLAMSIVAGTRAVVVLTACWPETRSDPPTPLTVGPLPTRSIRWPAPMPTGPVAVIAVPLPRDARTRSSPSEAVRSAVNVARVMPTPAPTVMLVESTAIP